MKRLVMVIICAILLVFSQMARSEIRFGESLCGSPDYTCLTIKSGDNWENLFPSIEERDIIKRINRMNTSLRAGMTLAVPKNIDRLSIYDVSPFPRYIEPTGEKTIFVSQKQLA